MEVAGGHVEGVGWEEELGEGMGQVTWSGDSQGREWRDGTEWDETCCHALDEALGDVACSLVVQGGVVGGSDLEVLQDFPVVGCDQTPP